MPLPPPVAAPLAAGLAAVAAAAVASGWPRARRRALQSAGRMPRTARRVKGDLSYEELYRPSVGDMRSSNRDGENERQGRGRQEAQRPAIKDNAAPWRKENARLREDPSYTQKWVWDPNPRGKKRTRWGKGTQVDRTNELDQQAAKLRALYKRPRFGWKEVMKDDLRTSALSDDLPAIGDGEVWLSKFLAHTGACSRRDVKELVLQGRVAVNGEIVQDPVMKVSPKTDKVMLDGNEQKLHTLGEIIWIMLYKPRGCISTMEDSEGRKTVMDLVPFAKKRRLVPVGRIDRNAAGLLLLTNDYEWHTILTHPRHEHSKRYQVQIYNGVPARAKIQALQAGLELPDEPRPLLPIKDLEVMLENKAEQIATLRLTLNQGVYRQIRRMFEFIGHPVKSIKRVQFGLLKLDRALKPGDYRLLNPREIRQLKGSTILKRPTGHPGDIMREAQSGNIFEGSLGELKRSSSDAKPRLRLESEDEGWRRPRRDFGGNFARQSRFDSEGGGRPRLDFGARTGRQRRGNDDDEDNEEGSGRPRDDFGGARSGRQRGGDDDDDDDDEGAGRARLGFSGARSGRSRRGDEDDDEDDDEGAGRPLLDFGGARSGRPLRRR